LKKLFSKYTGDKGSFRRNSLIMSSGAIVNIVVAFILTPIVTRLFSQEEFGIFYIYASIVAIASLVINGMYPHAFVVPKYKRDFLALLKVCFTLTFGGLLFFYLCIFLFGDWFCSILSAEAIIPFKYLLPIGLLVTTLNILFSNWNVRRKEFKKNASSNVVLSASAKGAQIGYGTLISGSFPGLIYSDIISKALATTILVSKTMAVDFALLKRITINEMKAIAIEFKKYPIYLLSSNFVNRFTSDIPIYILSSFFGLGAVGAFGFANTIMQIPFNVIGNSIAPVYFQRANELYLNDKESLKAFTIKSYDKMLLLGSLAYGFIFAFGDIIFKYVFSAEWELAGKLAMILSVYYVFKLISSPFARIFRVVRREEITLKVNIFLAVMRLVCLVLGLIFNNLYIAIVGFSFGNLLGYAYNNFEVFKIIGISRSHILTKTIKIMVPIFIGFTLFRFLILNFIEL